MIFWACPRPPKRGSRAGLSAASPLPIAKNLRFVPQLIFLHRAVGFALLSLMRKDKQEIEQIMQIKLKYIHPVNHLIK